ncbi:low-specificity L-threonine aldolase [Ramlibacter sp. PS3R-8]|uniref:low-specificity L-threonine aldolase n=1 Tax=Ramlibacter sp. PS3R-8 TaxID=3133437 RepID=UPI0030A9D4C2
MARTIDLRSDTVTAPGRAMRDAMHAAVVGDDDYGEDPTVQRLQATVAERLGFEAGLFVPSGTQGNLVALMTHCQRGDEYIAGQEAHAYKFEGGGAAVLGSIQPQPLPNEADGSISLAAIEAAIKPVDKHFARTRLIALENTISGRVLAQAYVRDVLALAGSRGLATHLDGARICNAAVKQRATPAELARGFDSVSVCLSKGLGAPVGSVLCGSAGFIAEATRWRKMLGGQMRQAGVLAAAGLYAFEHNFERLEEDHANAALLAREMEQMGFHVSHPQTNIFYANLQPEECMPLDDYLKTRGIRMRVTPRMRVVLHLDVSRADVLAVVEALKAYRKT